MVLDNSTSFQEVSLEAGRSDYQLISRVESQEHSNAPSPESTRYGTAGYAPLDAGHPYHTDPPTTEDQQSTSHAGNISPETASQHSTIKEYNHRASRKFLLLTGFKRLCVTVFLCLSTGLTLEAYQGFNQSNPRALSKSDVRTFNAIILGVSLALGLNISSSLKHYGSLLRWSILNRRFVSLQAFDLILGCENLSSVFKLLVLSFPGINRIPTIKFPPWRQDSDQTISTTRRRLPKHIWSKKDLWHGSKYTWLVCFAWLLINVGAQVLVATLSIFWPVDTLDTMPLTGNISISNLETWQADSFPLQLSSANLYGISGSQYPVFPKGDSDNIVATTNGIYILKGDAYYEYAFRDRNPSDMNSDNVASSRSVRSEAACVPLTFRDDSGKPVKGMVEASLDDGNTFSNYTVIRAVGGQITWTGMLSPPCGPRCTTLLVYQRSDSKEVDKNSMFMCNSTLSTVDRSTTAFSHLKEQDKPHIDSTDDFARIAAGAIAWTGYFDSGNKDNQTRTYLDGLPFSPNHTVSQADVEDLISRFSIGAIAAFDDRGPRYIVSNPQFGPVRDQQLRVDWTRVIIILTWICLVQSAAFLALLAFANKSIIRDESYFSLAMLLSPVVERIGREGGMNLSGEEMYNHPSVLGQRIRYDYVKVKTATGKLRKVDLLFKENDGSEDYKVRRQWADGSYI